MERFWRTLRERCLDVTGPLASLHDLNVRLYAWLDQRYHATPHAALFGKSPAQVYESEPPPVDNLDERRLRDALTVQAWRRVRRDNTLAMDGEDWETHLGFLAGHLVTISRCLVTPNEPPWLEHEGKRHVLSRVDPVRNGKRPRSAQNLDKPHEGRVPFDPPRRCLIRPSDGSLTTARRSRELEYLQSLRLQRRAFLQGARPRPHASDPRAEPPRLLLRRANVGLDVRPNEISTSTCEGRLRDLGRVAQVGFAGTLTLVHGTQVQFDGWA
jgi:hypothetical protein